MKLYILRNFRKAKTQKPRLNKMDKETISKELKKSTKKELIRQLIAYKGNRQNINNLFAEKNWQIRNFRLRLTKIRNEIDYLLQHPYSLDTSAKGKTHKRDGLSLAHRKGLLNSIRRQKQ